MNAFVGRQAILDSQRDVYGYELLFRLHPDNNSADTQERDFLSPASKTLHLMSSSLLSIGLPKLVGSTLAFVNFDREALMADWGSVLPAGGTVVEILEDVPADGEVLDACHRIRQQGYRIALDDFLLERENDPLLDVCDLVKLEIQAASRPDLEQGVRQMHRRGLRVLAERVETLEEFDWAKRAGFDLFQGYFFARPEIVAGRETRAERTSCIRLIRESQRDDIDLEGLTRLIESEVTFVYKLLRYVNSALMGHRKEIRSVRQALLFLGLREMRKWVALVALPTLGANKPTELVTQSLNRARMSQTLACRIPRVEEESAFLIGLLSLMDVLLSRPLEETLKQVSLEPSLAAVLLHQPEANETLHTVYSIVLAYEKADWDAVQKLGKKVGLNSGQISDAYLEAIQWTTDTLHMLR